jgi:hypothetical protein
MRCHAPCGKVIYTTETMAQLACVKVALSGDASLAWYYSRECKAWHLTASRKRGKTGKRVKWVEGFESGTGTECAA